MIENTKNDLINLFKKLGAVKFGKFILTSGKESDIYIDARKVALNRIGLSLIVDGFIEIISDIEVEANDKVEFKFDTVGGLETGANVIVGGMLSQVFVENGFVWKKNVKTHGTKQQYEGTIGDTAILVDDVATSGGSFVQVIEGMKLLFPNVKIEAAFAVVDRQEGAKEALASLDVPLYSILTKQDLLDSQQY